MSSTKPKTSPITGPHTRAHSDLERKPQVSFVWAMGMPGIMERARVTATISAAKPAALGWTWAALASRQ